MQIVAIVGCDSLGLRGAWNHRHFTNRRAGLPRRFLQHARVGWELEKLKQSREFRLSVIAEVLIAQGMDATGQALAQRHDLLLVERPSLHLLLERQPQPKIPIASLVEARRTHRHRERVADDVQKMRVGEVLDDEGHELRIGVLKWLLVADPEEFGFLLRRQERRPAFHQSLLDRQEIFARTLLATEQVGANVQGVTQAEVRVPRMGLKWLVPGKLEERPDDVGFMRNEDLRMQVQHPDQLRGAGAFVPDDEHRPNHGPHPMRPASHCRHKCMARFPVVPDDHANEYPTLRVVLYNLALLLASPVLLAGFVLHALLDRRVRAGHAYRCGLRLPPRPRRTAVWVHAVSVGEVNSVQRLIEMILAAGHYEVYLSTTTATGFDIAQRIYQDTVTLFYFPMDLRFVIRRFFDIIRPAAVIVAEVEIWPNFLDLARQRNVPVFLVNGRIGKKELAGYRPLRWFFTPFYSIYRKVFAQSEGDRARMIEIGMPARSITVTKNLKGDFSFSLDAERLAEIRRLIPEGRTVIVAGSTHAPEERHILDACRSLRSAAPFLVIAPRNIDRADAIRELCAAHGFTDALVVETTGDLPYLYACADIVIMGGSFSPEVGGHNFLEPLSFSKAVIAGPCMQNFLELDHSYAAQGGICKVGGVDQIGPALEELIRDPAQRSAIGSKGHELLLAGRGGSEETYAAIFDASGIVGEAPGVKPTDVPPSLRAP